MNQEQWIVVGVLIGSLALFVWGRWRHDLVALGALLVVALTDIVDPANMFSGFGHPAVITVAAVLIISKGLLNAGVVDMIARMLSRVGDRPNVQVMSLTALVAVCSGFMNNVGALALLMPVAVRMARRSGYSASHLLMPLAFGSLLGGTLTLIGTPPNIIIATFRTQAGSEPFGMFSFLPVGLGVTVAGLVVICLLSRWLVSEREGQRGKEELFTIKEYLAEVRVTEESKVAHKTLHDLEHLLDDEAEITVVGLLRGDKRIPAPSSFEVLIEDDVLLVQANSDDLQTLIDQARLKLTEEKEDDEDSLQSDVIVVTEAVVGHNSRLVGNTCASVDLRRRFGANLLAVARHGQQLRRRLSLIRFVTGDILLLQGPPETMSQTLNELGCLPLADRNLRVGKARQVFTGVLIFGAGIALTTAGLLPVQVSLTLTALVMLLTGVVALRELYEAIDWPVIVLLAAMIPVGEAFEATGTASLVADQVARVADWSGSVAALGVLMVAAMLLSNVINNAAAAVLMAPIGLHIAETVGASADPFLMAVAIGASSAFLTPIGHQSNTLVMEPGGYRFGDYWRLGLPVSIAVLATGIPLILWVWRF